MALTELAQGGIAVGVIIGAVFVLGGVTWIAECFKHRGLKFLNPLKGFMEKRQMRAALRVEDTAPRGTV